MKLSFLNFGYYYLGLGFGAEGNDWNVCGKYLFLSVGSITCTEVHYRVGYTKNLNPKP